MPSNQVLQIPVLEELQDPALQQEYAQQKDLFAKSITVWGGTLPMAGDLPG